MLRTLLRITILSAVILLSLYQSINYLRATKGLGSLENDPVTLWENKLTKLKNALPADVSTVGYLSDWDVPGIKYANGDQHGEYVLIQYALSPVIAVRGSDREWSVGNFTPDAYKKWLSTTHGEFEVTFFKHNLYLIHRNEP